MNFESVKSYLFIIKESWIDNLRALKPGNLGKLLLVTLKGAVESVRSLLFYLLGLLLLFGLKNWLIKFLPVFLRCHAGLIYCIILGLLCFNIVLSLRSSVKIKDLEYYLEYQKYLLPGSVIIFLFCLVDFYFDIKLFLIPVLWLLFLTDSELNIKNFFVSAYRAILMLVANLPLFLIIRFVLFGFINILKLSKLAIKYFVPNTTLALSGLGLIVFYIILYLVLTYFIALVSKIYVKRVHEQFNLYF